ncbi:MAG: exodeoxyribonuclease VII small subunit [Defluviitaleaceae bacterium]|nr:exodeoxyribonuclease VII small subunit [Defluviitaleaceae bacterium]
MKKINIEDNLKYLDKIIDKMESGELGIQESLALYREAVSVALETESYLSVVSEEIMSLRSVAGVIQMHPFFNTRESDKIESKSAETPKTTNK